MKISGDVLTKMLAVTMVSTTASATAAPNPLAEIQYEIGPVAKDTLITAKTDIKDVRQHTTTKLVGISEKASLILRKGARLNFRGDCGFQIAPLKTLTLEADSSLIMKPGSNLEINTSCVIPAKQIFIIDSGKVLKSVGGAPAIYASQAAPAGIPQNTKIVNCPACGGG